MKNTKLYSYIKGAALLALCGAGMMTHRASAQTYICYQDSFCFEAPGARGTVTWYASESGGPYDSIATGNPFCDVPPVGDFMIYGAIVEGTCDTIFTDTMHVIANSEIVISTTNDTLLLTDCNATLFGIGTMAGLGVSGGVGPYTYAWSPATGLSSATVMDPDYTGPGAKGYFVFTLTVTDAVGCTASHNITIHIDPQGVTSYNFTGGIQTFTVPACVDTLFLQAWGGQGGSGATGGSSASGGAGGLGGYSEGWLLVTPGDVLNVFVGGQGATPTGGFNGGANGGSANAGGGGGASDVRAGGTAEANRVLTAGGGGGGGRAGCESSIVAGGTGGSGGGGVGTNGTDAPTSGGVAGGGKGGNFGAVQGAAGPAGTGCAGFLGSPGNAALAGTGGSGGAGQSCCCFTFGSIPGGGGGGGGHLGGGGGGGGSAGTTGCSGNDKGAGGGGGGGSSYTGGVLSGATNPGIWLGNGMVTISW